MYLKVNNIVTPLRSEKIIQNDDAIVELINIKPTPQQSGMATPNNDSSLDLDIQFHACPIELPTQVEAKSKEMLKKLQDMVEENSDV